MNRRNALCGIFGWVGLTDLERASRLPQRIEVGGSVLDVFVDSDEFELGRAALTDWVARSANAVTGYFGRFPVARARVYITVAQHGRISGGVSYGDGGAHCRISVGRDATLKDLYNDWELTHEMVHFGFPSVDDRNHWMEEGTATYVEPIARASIGIVTAERVWGDMLRDIPQGLPEAGDLGLDRTHTWGRTYWGGALFCLIADIEMRRRTRNVKGLQDALRAINGAGGTIEAEWPLQRALKIGDQATDGNTLMELYSKMGLQPVDVDLAHLWRQLGVRLSGETIVLDDRAPWAAIRASICRSITRKG
jgi:hypothetical protein